VNDADAMVEAAGGFATRSNAELAQGALAAAGISSVIAADDAGGAYPFDLTGGARLLVEQDNAEAAAAVLATELAQTQRSSDDGDVDHHCVLGKRKEHSCLMQPPATARQPSSSFTAPSPTARAGTP
jgi:hypothetical protein